MMDLRPYQEEGIAAVLESWKKSDRVLVSMPTGTGKTVLFGSLLSRILRTEPRARGLVLAHRDELIEQACEKWRSIDPGIEPGVVQGSRNEWQSRLVVASVQSLHRKRREQIPVPFDFVVIDEAHHAQAENTYGQVLKWAAEQRTDCKVLGVTATPYRGDQRGLGGGFQKVAFSYSIVKAVEDGFLSPLDAYAIKTGIDLDDVERNRGELHQGQLGAVVNTADCNRLVSQAYRKYCGKDKAVAFCVDVLHAQSLAQQFRSDGVRAAAIWGAMGTESRKATLARFRKGELDVLTNCMVLTEGWDCPELGAVLLVRPTMSQVVYVQQVGRVTRLNPGKTCGKVLDFTFNSSSHRLIGFADLSREQERQAAAPAGGEGNPQVRQVQIRPKGEGLRAFHVNILGESKLSAGWSEFGNEWFASWGSVCAVLRPVDPSSLAGEWLALVLKDKGDRKYDLAVSRGSFITVARSTEEKIVEQLGNNVLSRADAAWKRRPASKKLIEACERWKVPMDDQATMGEASARLGYAIACSNIRKIRRGN